MQVSAHSFDLPRRSPNVPPDALSGAQAPMHSQPRALDPVELELLTLNLDGALRVHSRPQFFTWVQGLLQNLLPHEVLVCVLHNPSAASYQVESFAAAPIDQESITDAFHRDAAVWELLVQAWEDNRFQPVVCNVRNGPYAEGALARELRRIGVENVLVHGTYDVFGKLESVFLFARKADGTGPHQVYLAELIVPFLHAAWVRAQVRRPAEHQRAHAGGADVLTERQKEILKWVYQGKSNMEIGAILGISTLTVKNHVQRILRKLQVQNRAQAVGKALAQRILNL